MTLTPGCESECRESKTCCLYDDGTIGQGIPVDKSQMILQSERGMGHDLRVGDDRKVCSLRISGSCCCAVVIFLKSTIGVPSRSTESTPICKRASTGVLLAPLIYRMSEVN